MMYSEASGGSGVSAGYVVISWSVMDFTLIRALGYDRCGKNIARAPMMRCRKVAR